MSGRITAAFARARSEGRAALVVYLTGYDGGPEASLACLRAAVDAGADVIELGVPFSDPTADGPAIQAAMVRALGAGATLPRVLELGATLRRHTEVPIVVFGYANPIVRRGPEAVARAIAEAGLDGMLVVDLPAESAELVRAPVRGVGLDWIGLVAPTSTPARTQAIVAAASGFVYAITMRGVTGAPLVAGDDVAVQLATLRRATSLPLAAGFGIRTPEDVRRIAASADGVVVGSALVEASTGGAAALGTAVAALRAATIG